MLSDTLRYINLAGLAIGLVTLCGPMHLCVCVNEESVDGEGGDSQTLSDTLRCIHKGADSEALSDTLRYINLTGLAVGIGVRDQVTDWVVYKFGALLVPTGYLTHTRQSDGTHKLDGALKNTVRTKILHHRRRYLDRPDPISSLHTSS